MALPSPSLFCGMAVAAAWAGIMAFVWRSMPRSPAYLRRIIFVGGGVSVSLILILGSVINRFFIVGKAAVKMESVLQANAPSHAANEPEPVEIIVTIHKDNSVDVDGGAAMPAASLKEELRKHLPANKKVMLTVISEPDAQYGITADVLDICKELKIDHVTFAVSQPE